MKCALCKHGTTYSGIVAVTLERDNRIIIIKGVPADICENCGEYYLSQNITAQVLSRAEQAIDLVPLTLPNRDTGVEILQFAA